ncbi:MAG TPA: DMT family transporter [Streptosporangiaceae bacterium]
MRDNRSTSEPARKAALQKAAPFLLGAIGVVCFSLTFPTTAAAEVSFSPLTVGVGRSVVAAIPAIIALLGRRQPLLPPREAMGRMLIVVATVGVGFGLLSALALRQVGSVHTAVIAGLIPAATAGMAAWRGGERPSRGYWGALALGLGAVIAFALIQGGGTVRLPDLVLLVAITVGGLGYAEGGVLARTYGGWRVICWAIVLALPISVPVTVIAVIADPPKHIALSASAGLAYLGVVSMCLGFFAWYQAMATGGVAAIGRLQLAQPALTLGWSALLLSEHVSLLSAAAAAVVIIATAIGRNAKVERRPMVAAGPTGAAQESTAQPAPTTPVLNATSKTPTS